MGRSSSQEMFQCETICPLMSGEDFVVHNTGNYE
jgi:hypothetical protein